MAEIEAYRPPEPEGQSKKTPERVLAILADIATGKTVSASCKDNDLHFTTWHGWVETDTDLAAAYARARTKGFDAMADKMIDIADSTRASSDHVALARLRIDVRKTLLSKWDPSRYGDSATLNLGNKDDKPFEVKPTVDGIALTKTIAQALRRGLLPPPSEDTGDDLL